MPLIHPSAYLVLCSSCRLHGHIVFVDGLKSRPFGSKETARTEIMLAESEGRLSPEEIMIITEQLWASSFPMSRSQFDDAFDHHSRLMAEKDQEMGPPDLLSGLPVFIQRSPQLS
ncbi:MAG: hypothetical protein V4465_02120 [Patescibacteria group bacterium]